MNTHKHNLLRTFCKTGSLHIPHSFRKSTQQDVLSFSNRDELKEEMKSGDLPPLFPSKKPTKTPSLRLSQSAIDLPQPQLLDPEPIIASRSTIVNPYQKQRVSKFDLTRAMINEMQQRFENLEMVIRAYDMKLDQFACELREYRKDVIKILNTQKSIVSFIINLK